MNKSSVIVSTQHPQMKRADDVFGGSDDRKFYLWPVVQGPVARHSRQAAVAVYIGRLLIDCP